jgi:acyl carrier protein
MGGNLGTRVRRTGPGGKFVTAQTWWVQQLAATPLSERSTLIESLVATEFRVWLLMEDTELLPFDESYFELGLTSLGAVEIEQRLEAAIGRPIDSTSLFNNPTVSHLLNHLRTDVLGEFFPVAPVGAVPAASGGSSRKDLLAGVLSDLYKF